MLLKNAIPISLAATSLLSIFMLQMGSDDETSVRLPLAALFMIPLGIWLVDIKRLFSLPEWSVNLLILLVFILHLGRIFQSPSEFLAYSIANILVYVQIILFYRRKDVLADYHILILSFIQGGVACVFQQNPLFAPVLLAFSFAILCSLSLLFLNQERHYYQSHPFLKSAFDQGERIRRVTVGRLLFLAVKTIVVTPLIVFLGYRWKEWSASDDDEKNLIIHDHDGRTADRKSDADRETGGRMKADARQMTGVRQETGVRREDKERPSKTLFDFLRATWGDRALLGNVQSGEESVFVSAPSAPKTDSILFPSSKRPKAKGAETERGVRFSPPRAKRRFFGRAPENVLTAAALGKRGATGGEEGEDRSRWPLLRATPLFSGAVRSGEDPIVGRRLFVRLFIGAFFSLAAAGVIFLFFPRLQDLEIGSVRFGHDQWRGASPEVRSVTGFNEKMKLGEIGPSGNNYQSVMRVRFVDFSDPTRTAVEEGAFVWMRGTVLARYENREWFRPKRERFPTSRGRHPPSERSLFFGNSTLSRHGSRRFSSSLDRAPQKIPGFVFSERTDDYQRAIFDKRHPIVCQEIHLFPLTTRIIFSVWPFFQFDHEAGQMVGERYLRSRRDEYREISISLFTNAFGSGRQTEWVPADGPMASEAREEYSMIDRGRLSRLAALAREWDDESGIPKENLADRAKNLEDRLKNSGRFHYNRHGVSRDGELDPLEDFVTLHPEGHCEYFAGALAMMLRAIGIPSRVVVGFCFQNDPDSDGETTVRQSDAHSWVEAFIPFESVPKEVAAQTDWWRDGAWLRLDGTPAAASEILRSVSMTYQSWRELFTEVWNDYILNYNGSRQQENVYHPVAVAAGSVWGFLTSRLERLNPRNWTLFGLSEEGADFDQTTDAPVPFPWVELLTILIVLSLLILLTKRILARRATRKSAARPAHGAAGEHFGQLETFLARLGIVRRKSETPREFVGRFLTSPESDILCQVVADMEGDGACDAKNSSFRKTGRGRSVAIPPRVPSDRSEQAAKWMATPASVRNWLEENLRAFVEIYYGVRFGGHPLPDSERERFRQFFERTKRFSSGDFNRRRSIFPAPSSDSLRQPEDFSAARRENSIGIDLAGKKDHESVISEKIDSEETQEI